MNTMRSSTHAGKRNDTHNNANPEDWQDVPSEGHQAQTSVARTMKKKSVSSETFGSGWQKIKVAGHKSAAETTPSSPHAVASPPPRATERADEVTIAMADALKVVAINLGVWDAKFETSKEQVRALATGIIEEMKLSITEKETLQVAVAKQEKMKEQLAVIAFLCILFAAVTLLLSEPLD